MGGETAVQVAVRCRPHLAKIDGPRDKFVVGVEMDGHSTRIFNPETGENRKFTFDYSYWSFGENDPHYVGNQQIYEDMGLRVLDTAWQGYNVSLFAYGQTGSGKSYSMIGIDSDPGIVPKVSEEIFNRIDRINKEQDEKGVNEYERVHFEVSCSMLEIYNEKVRDLLNSKKQPAGGLKIRESKATGPFVDGLTADRVNSYEEIEKTMEEGTKMRTVRATKMNDSSSRAHTLVTITLVQKTKNKKGAKKPWSQKISKINLVDLAGSEKQRNTGTSGAGQKEGIAINQSLSYLGKCITALAKKATGNKRIVVPYRESKLTFIMKESLGGNSKTIMIAAIRPSAKHFSESLSTLRYANEAKKIKNKAVVNEDPKEKAIRELKEQVKLLKKQLEEKGTLGGSGDLDASFAGDDSNSESMNELQEQLKASNEIIAQLKETEEEAAAKNEEIKRLREQSLAAAGLGENFDRKNLPHILNMTEDPSQFGVIAYALDKEDELLGRDKECDITLNGLGITKEHCRFQKEGDDWYIVPFPDKSDTHINGVEAMERIKINHNDRLIFGNSHIFKFVIPTDASYDECHTTADCQEDWNFAQNEYAEQRGLIDAKQKAEQEALYEAKMKEMERKFLEQQAVLQQQREEMEQKMKQKDAALQAAKSEEERIAAEKAQLEARQQQEAMEREITKKAEEAALRMEFEKQRKAEREELEAKIAQLLPLVKDANSMSKELDKDISYELKVYQDFDDDWSNTPITKIGIISKENKSGLTSMWGEDKFRDRQYVMKDMYAQYVDAEEDGETFNWAGDDPFDDEDYGDPQSCGHALVYLKSLAYLVDNDVFTGIINVHGKQEGEMKVQLVPCDENGDEENVDFIEESQELIGRDLHFKIRIPYARGLNKNRCEDPYCRFRMPFDLDFSETNVVYGRENNPQWNYERLVHICPVTPQILKYIENSMLKIEVFAKQCNDNRKRKRASEYEQELKVKDNTIGEVKMNLKYILEQRDDLEVENSQLQTELDQVLSELEELQTGFFDDEMKLGSPSTPSLAPQGLLSDLESLSTAKEALESQNESLKTKLEEATKALEEAKTTTTTNPENYEKMKEELESSRSRQERMQEKIRELQEKVESNPPASTKGTLALTLVRGTDCGAKDVDAYVQFKLGKQKQKSKTIKNNMNPEWNESFNFDIQDSTKDCIKINLYDDDLLSADDLLGTADMSLSNLVDQRKNPVEILIVPNTKNSKSKAAKLHFVLQPNGFGSPPPAAADHHHDDEELQRLQEKIRAQANEIINLRQQTSTAPSITPGHDVDPEELNKRDQEIEKLRAAQKDMEIKLLKSQMAQQQQQPSEDDKKKSSVCVVM